MLHHKTHQHHGMTLMEVLVIVGVVSFVLAAVSNSFISLYKSNTTGARSIVQVSNGRKGVELIMQDLRSASFGGGGENIVASMSPTALTFYTTLPSGGGNARVAYSLQGTLLTRSVILAGTPATYSGTASVSTIVNFVHNTEDGIALFRYYDKNGNEITDTTQTNSVAQISIVIDVLAGGTTPFFITATSTLRNLRSL